MSEYRFTLAESKVSHEPKTDCFAYGDPFGRACCKALTDLYCKKDGKCAFYKPSAKKKDRREGYE